MPTKGDILRCVSGMQIGSRLLVIETRGTSFECEVLEKGILNNTPDCSTITLSYRDFNEFYIVEEK